jgi:NTP pyrophosphatase (non-canonical NTP hydrolase)
MNPYDYTIATRRTRPETHSSIAARLSHPQSIDILHAAMGCVTEAGELMDAVKKASIYGKPVDRTNLIEEAGDMLWYLALLLDSQGITFNEVMDINIAKLKKRFPEKFTEYQSLNRDLDAERKVLDDGAKSC